MLKTITLDIPLTFQEAMQYLIAGKCLGIRPGTNTGFVELYKPHWMNSASPDSMLRWHGESGNAGIRTNQYLETWYPVIIDHRTLAAPAPAAE